MKWTHFFILSRRRLRAIIKNHLLWERLTMFSQFSGTRLVMWSKLTLCCHLVLITCIFFLNRNITKSVVRSIIWQWSRTELKPRYSVEILFCVVWVWSATSWAVRRGDSAAGVFHRNCLWYSELLRTLLRRSDVSPAFFLSTCLTCGTAYQTYLNKYILAGLCSISQFSPVASLQPRPK